MHIGISIQSVERTIPPILHRFIRYHNLFVVGITSGFDLRFSARNALERLRLLRLLLYHLDVWTIAHRTSLLLNAI